MPAPLSLVKRLRIFVSHPHVEWHETSAVLGDQAYKEINDSRRLERAKASNKRERQHELQALRRELEVRSADVNTALGKDVNQAFMTTLDAVPAIAAPIIIHASEPELADAFAETNNQLLAYRPRQTRISGEVRTPAATALVGFAMPASTSANAGNTAQEQTRSKLPESIQSAAIALAVGDKPSARAQLKAAFAMAPNKRVFAQAWLECLRACEEKPAYEAASKSLTELHDFVVPTYEASFAQAVAPSAAHELPHQQATLPLSKQRLTCPQELDAYAADSLLELVNHLHVIAAQHGEAESLAVMSFVQLKHVAASGAQGLAQALALLNDTPTPFVLQGGTVLLDVLLDLFTTQKSLPDIAYWHAALQACRLLGRADSYESLLNKYYNRYMVVCERNMSDIEGISAEYIWLASKATYQTFNRAVDDAANLAFSIESGSHKAGSDSMLPLYTPYAQPVSQAKRTQSLRVIGEGTHDRIARVLELADSAEQGYTAIELDFSRMAFIEFEAAVALLNWAQHKRETGVSVTIKGHGLLTHALFEQISLADVAELHPHYF
jgi:ABC-type transporter Mla MlaB component